MANSIMSQLVSAANFRIYDEEYGIAVWTDLKVESVSITADAHTAQNPMSNVYAASDTQDSTALENDLKATKVIQPISVTVNCKIQSISTTSAIGQAFSSQTKTYRVVAKGLTAQGMALTGVQIDQSPEALSAISCELTFEQAEIPSTTGFNPSSSSDSDTYGLTVDADDSIDDTVESVYNTVSSLWS